MNKLSREKHQPKYNGQELMEYIASAKFEDLPDEVVTRAKHIVMDAVACMLSGRKTRQLFDITWDYMAPNGDIAPVGCDFKTTPAMAAFFNTCHAQTHDFNDGLNNSGMRGGAYHPGRVVVSAALAVAEKVHASGKDLLLAVVLGIEAAARMRSPKHCSLIADCYSVAVTAAKLMGGSAEQIRSACSLASFLCMVDEMKENGAGWKSEKGHKSAGPTMNSMKYAYLCRNSLEATELAMQGYEGSGLYDSVGASSRYATLGLGKTFECMDMYFKPWPCCRKTQGALEAALTLRNEYGVKPEDVESVRVFYQMGAMYVNSPFDANTDVNYNGQFSIQYIITCAFLDGNLELRHFRWPDRRAPEQYVEFAKKITAIADNGLDGHNAIAPNHNIVEVDLKYGETLSLYCEHPLGAEPNPMSEEQRIAKLRMCAEDMTEVEKDRLVNWILSLDKLESL